MPADNKTPSAANQSATDGALAEHFTPQALAHPDLTRVYPLADGKDAFVARLALIEEAKHSLDVQYYILHDDISGHLFLQHLYKAAERGVKVRLLLDDTNTKGLDPTLVAFDQHPNIDVRLFNPFMQRDVRVTGYLSDFFRLNRRMHNKSLTADGIATIIGGRNVGDEYFGAGSGVMFADLDVLAVGQAVQSVSDDFYRYWQSESTYGLDGIVTATPIAFDTTPAGDSETQSYIKALADTQFVKQLQAGTLPMYWATATLISDNPAKGLGKASMEQTVVYQLKPLMAGAKENLTVVSPYFVPTEEGTQMFADIAQSGKTVTILTNAFAATDVASVHAGYAKYRKDLINAGIELYELKPDATVHTTDHGGVINSSGASLHAKTFSIDGKSVFVGSFNMDPRSATLNTELGLMIDSPELAKLMDDSLSTHLDKVSYKVLSEGRDLQWQETQDNGETVIYDIEPHSNIIQRILVRVCSWLPIEWML